MLEPINQELLEGKYNILRRGDTTWRENAFALARFAEAYAISEGNRQIEALTPKKANIVLPVDITPEDHKRMTLNLRSQLFSYFIWHYPAETDTVQLLDLVNEGVRRIESLLGYKGEP